MNVCLCSEAPRRGTETETAFVGSKRASAHDNLFLLPLMAGHHSKRVDTDMASAHWPSPESLSLGAVDANLRISRRKVEPVPAPAHGSRNGTGLSHPVQSWRWVQL